MTDSFTLRLWNMYTWHLQITCTPWYHLHFFQYFCHNSRSNSLWNMSNLSPIRHNKEETLISWEILQRTMPWQNQEALTCIGAVSCGYDTCFVVKTCDGLCHFIFSLIVFGYHYTEKLTRSTLALKLSVSPPYYPWVTAKCIVTNCDHTCRGREASLWPSWWSNFRIKIYTGKCYITEFEWTNGQTNPFVVPYWQMMDDNIKKWTSGAFNPLSWKTQRVHIKAISGWAFSTEQSLNGQTGRQTLLWYLTDKWWRITLKRKHAEHLNQLNWKTQRVHIKPPSTPSSTKGMWSP